MVFKSLCILVIWTKEASALEGLRGIWLPYEVEHWCIWVVDCTKAGEESHDGDPYDPNTTNTLLQRQDTCNAETQVRQNDMQSHVKDKDHTLERHRERLDITRNIH